MKKIVSRLLAACLLTGGLLGCNSRLDVKPINQIDAATALNTSSDVQAALVGTYTGLQSVENYGGYIQLMSDLLADNGDLDFVGTFIPPPQFQRKSLLKDNGFVESMWLRSYDVINRSNGVLANVDKLDTPTKKANSEGEAKFIRSLVYFDLVRLYARAWNDGTPASNPGVPLVLTPTTVITAASQVSRNSVAEVYDRIILDLVSAEGLLSARNGFFASKGAAAALLARVYLQQGRYPDAAAAANRAIVAAGGSLNGSYAANFTDIGGGLVPNTPEDIFAIQTSSQSGRNELNTFYSINRRGDIEVQPQLLSQFEPGDDRRTLFTAIGSPPVYSKKYDALYGGIKVFRLAEMYLTRGEANFRAGTVVGDTPLNDINRIRTRAKLPALTALTLPAILKERKLELHFEGFALGDLKRTQGSTKDPTGTTVAWNSSRLVLPIPLREINANPNLVQNAGY